MILLDGKLDGTVCEVENWNKKAICQFLPTKHFFYDLYISFMIYIFLFHCMGGWKEKQDYMVVKAWLLLIKL